jgi:hypothetical protein
MALQPKPAALRGGSNQWRREQVCAVMGMHDAAWPDM